MKQDRIAIVPLGDSALLVRFGTELDAEANRRAVAFARRVLADPIEHVIEVVPSLVSVLVRYDPLHADPVRLSGELSLRLRGSTGETTGMRHRIEVRYGGEDGPDLDAVAGELGLSPSEFVARHVGEPVRVLTTGFAPGFVYCGFHAEDLIVPRREAVRPLVPAGSVLFAAGQTAIAATDTPTGWHVIGRTAFGNFDPDRVPPTVLDAGDLIEFVSI